MRWLWVLLVLPLLGLTPIYNEHTTQDKVDEEFRNIFLNVQPLQFIVVTSTPNATEYQEGQIVIFSSGVIKLMLSQGSTVYQVTFSSISGK